MKTEKFEVKGNCGTCKERIEKAAKSIDSVTTADWNEETEILEVTFDLISVLSSTDLIYFNEYAALFFPFYQTHFPHALI